MKNKLMKFAKNNLTGIVNRITNAGAVPKGGELYDYSPLAITSESIETQRTAGQSFRSSLEDVASQIHTGFTYDNTPFEVGKEGEGTQLFVATHKDSPLKKGIVMIGRGDYHSHSDVLKEICATGYSKEKAAEAWLRFLTENMRVDLITNGPVKTVANEANITPAYLGSLVNRVLVKGRSEQPEKISAIDTTEQIIFPLETAEIIAQNSTFIQVIPVSAGVQKMGPYNKQLVEYKIKIFDPLHLKKTNSEDNPFKLAKELDPKAIPQTEIDAIATFLAAYEKQNPTKSIFIATSPEKKNALNLGKRIEDITKRTEKIPIDVIVPKRPNYYENALHVEVKNPSLTEKITKYAIIGAATIGIGTLCYRGIFPEKFAKCNYQLRVDNQIADGNETYMGRDRTIEIEVLADGNRIIKHSLILPKDKKTKTAEKSVEKKKKGWFN